MALLDSKQTVDLDVSAKEPIQIEFKVGQKVVLIAALVALSFVFVKVAK